MQKKKIKKYEHYSEIFIRRVIDVLFFFFFLVMTNHYLNKVPVLTKMPHVHFSLTFMQAVSICCQKAKHHCDITERGVVKHVA